MYWGWTVAAAVEDGWATGPSGALEAEIQTLKKITSKFIIIMGVDKCSKVYHMCFTLALVTYSTLNCDLNFDVTSNV